MSIQLDAAGLAIKAVGLLFQEDRKGLGSLDEFDHLRLRVLCNKETDRFLASSFDVFILFFNSDLLEEMICEEIEGVSCIGSCKPILLSLTRSFLL